MIQENDAMLQGPLALGTQKCAKCSILLDKLDFKSENSLFGKRLMKIHLAPRPTKVRP